MSHHRNVTMTLLVIVIICLSNYFGNCNPASIRHSQLGNKLSTKNIVKGKAIRDSVTQENVLPTESPLTKGKENSTHSSHFSIQDILRQLVTASNAVEHLEKMKNRLLNQFQNKTGEFATARGGYGGYGAYGFPSLEGALLSLAFLTFAVFLIDLIQQLLSRFRTGTVPLVGRRKRSFIPDDEYDPISSLTHSVLKALETPYFKL